MDFLTENNDDEDENLRRSSNFTSLVIESVGAFVVDYCNIILSKSPCMMSEHTNIKWMRDILQGHPERCRRMMRMEARDFLQLCIDLEQSHGLKPSRNMPVIEKVGIFIFTLAQGMTNRQVQERFQHSGETISRIFHEVLLSVCKMGDNLIKPTDPEFRAISPQIYNDRHYMPHFKDCIGVIDGIHINVIVPVSEQVRYIGRKGQPTQNILAICNFDMKFTYVLAGFEGSAHDSHILNKAISIPTYNFPKPPPGKYYLVDAGYSQMTGYLGPYKGVRHHFTDYQHGQPPQEYKEVFNKAHASLRSCIKRTFGVWKKRWEILHAMPSYNYKTQVKIVVATIALHNYIRGITYNDVLFQEVDAELDLVEVNMSDEEEENQSHQDNEMDNIRYHIAMSLMESHNL